MPVLITGHGVGPLQVEVPDKIDGRDLVRSKKGALHLRPNSTHDLSEDEISLLLKAHPDLLGKCRVWRKPDRPKRTALALPVEDHKKEKTAKKLKDEDKS